jgi:hypothetical protein
MDGSVEDTLVTLVFIQDTSVREFSMVGPLNYRCSNVPASFKLVQEGYMRHGVRLLHYNGRQVSARYREITSFVGPLLRHVLAGLFCRGVFPRPQNISQAVSASLPAIE